MKTINKILITILISSLLTSCDFINNSFTAKDKTKELVDAVLQEDYDKAVGYLAMDHEMAKDTDIDKMNAGLVEFREMIVKNFGTELDYTFMNTEKKFSSEEQENTLPNTTVALIQFSNGKDFGVFNVVFDDESGKILNINALDIKEPIPSMAIFWLFGILAICVPIFNIYVIIKIKRSNLRRKWLKYVAIIFLNVPSITYAAISGLSFKILSFQILLGVSFSYMGFLNSYWTLGIPLGGIYWLWKLKQREYDAMFEDLEPEISNDIPTKTD